MLLAKLGARPDYESMGLAKFGDLLREMEKLRLVDLHFAKDNLAVLRVSLGGASPVYPRGLGFMIQGLGFSV